jgi:glycerol-1-phosphate dehydrogenase [NAD(P)+]
VKNRIEQDALVKPERETEVNLYCPGALDQLDSILAAEWGADPALIVTDGTIWEAVSHRFESFLKRRPDTTLHVLPAWPAPYASDTLVAKIAAVLSATKAIPVAVGAGTINDIVKRAAFENGMRYCSVPTAPSVDGFTSFGAAITVSGFKTTLECPPPLCVVADEGIVAGAPAELVASGYGDIIAKLTGGGDWIIAEELGIESIDRVAWDLSQTAAIGLLSKSRDIREGDRESIGILYNGLISTGLAIQRYRDSRPASGAEHLLSHAWEMSQLQREGREVSHGFRVALGTLVSAALMSELFGEGGSLGAYVERNGFAPRLDLLDYRQALAELVPAASPMKERILGTIRSKTPGEKELAGRAGRARTRWPELSRRVLDQVPPFERLRRALREAACPTEPRQIGLSREDCADGLRIASLIRGRYTVLDLASELGVLDQAVETVFSSKYFGEYAPAR